jgi:hypothetical protein
MSQEMMCFKRIAGSAVQYIVQPAELRIHSQMLFHVTMDIMECNGAADCRKR